MLATLFSLRIYLLSILFAGVTFAQYPKPIPFNGTAARNNAGQLYYQDINIIRRADGTYFRFAKSNVTGQGLSVATAKTFRGNWTYSYELLGGPLKSPVAYNRSLTNLWDPECHFINSQYVLYYGVNNASDRFDLAVATSPDLTQGSWTDLGSMGVLPDTTDSIPARKYVRLGVNLFTNASSPSTIARFYNYITFGSWNHALYGVHLKTGALAAVDNERPQPLIADQYNSAPGSAERGNKTEGSYQIHWGDYIYHFYSIGSCCSGFQDAGVEGIYRVQVCRGNFTNGPTGPFYDRDGVNCLTGPYDRKGTTLVASHSNSTGKYEVYGPGSISILRDPVEGLVIYYQYRNLTDKNLSMQFGWNYLDFDAQGWPFLSPTGPTKV